MNLFWLLLFASVVMAQTAEEIQEVFDIIANMSRDAGDDDCEAPAYSDMNSGAHSQTCIFVYWNEWDNVNPGTLTDLFARFAF